MSAQPPDDRWLNEQLRNVPLPVGLKAQLRAVAVGSDAQFDGRLRDVPVPRELAATLRQIVDDEALDERLRGVALPAGLAAGLRGVPDDESLDCQLRETAVPENLVARIQEAIDDEATDQRLRDVPVPVHMISRLWSIAQRKPALVRMRQFALAASVFLMVGVSYLLAMLGIVGSAYNITLQPAPFVLRTDRVDLELDIVEPSLQDGDAFVQLPPMESPPELDGPPIDLVVDASPRSDDAIDEVRSLLRKSSRSLEDIYRQMWMGLGSPLATDDMLPELETAPPVTSRGVAPPLVRGFDRRFLLRTGVHPIVVPGVDEQLRRCAVPLWTATTSFDQAQQTLTEGHAPAPDRVRVEDFLAAIDYGFAPVQPGRLGIRTAAGPSPLSTEQARLLQIGVQAGPIEQRGNGAAQMTVVVDVSASMRMGGRLRAVRDALHRLIDQLETDDRLSLVVFAAEATTVFQSAGPKQALSLHAAVERAVVADGSTHLAKGVRLGAATALGGVRQRGATRSLVLISDGASDLPDALVAHLQQPLEQLAAANVALDVFDVSRHEQHDPVLARLADAGQGRIHTFDSLETMRWTLLERLWQASPVAAEQAELEITFNPKAVAGYRLLGHEESLAADSTCGPIRLRAGEAATALFELWLAPDSTDDDVAVARLKWVDPRSGHEHQLTQRISRVQFASSWSETAASLQAAAIAAQTAELLRQSVFARQSAHTLADLHELVDRLSPSVVDEPSLRRMIELALQAERVQRGRVDRTGNL